MSTVPVQAEQLITLALGIVFVTQFLKSLAGEIDNQPRLNGWGAIIVSAIIAVLLTGLSYAAGWVPLPVVTCAPSDPFGCVQNLITQAGASVAVANVLYVLVYARAFGKTLPPPKHL
jgi:hypothetical protein